jgi:hypothetical protein
LTSSVLFPIYEYSHYITLIKSYLIH